MKLLVFIAFLTFCLPLSKSDNELIDDSLQIYYDLDGNPVPLLSEDHSSNSNEPLLKSSILKYGILPCSCEEEYNCACCVNLRFIRFQRSICSNFSYDPNELSINMLMDYGGSSIFNRTLSAKNPPPACFDNPYIPGLRFCLKVFDIATPGRNIYMCINLETRLVTAPILVLEFDCVQMGVDGFMHGKPGEFPVRNSTLNVTEEDVVIDSGPLANLTELYEFNTTESNFLFNSSELLNQDDLD